MRSNGGGKLDRVLAHERTLRRGQELRPNGEDDAHVVVKVAWSGRRWRQHPPGDHNDPVLPRLRMVQVFRWTNKRVPFKRREPRPEGPFYYIDEQSTLIRPSGKYHPLRLAVRIPRTVAIKLADTGADAARTTGQRRATLASKLVGESARWA